MYNYFEYEYHGFSAHDTGDHPHDKVDIQFSIVSPTPIVT